MQLCSLVPTRTRVCRVRWYMALVGARHCPGVMDTCDYRSELIIMCTYCILWYIRPGAVECHGANLRRVGSHPRDNSRQCSYSSSSIVRSFRFKKFMMTVLVQFWPQKSKKFGMTAHEQPQEMSPGHYVAVVAGQKTRNQKWHRRVRRIPAGSKLWSTRARMFRLKNLWENKKFWMGVFRT